MPQNSPEFSAPSATFRFRHGRAEIDSDIKIFVTEFASGVRDFQLLRQVGQQELELLNPLELLDTQTAVQILEKVAEQPDSNANSWMLSRLLVQCLEYSHNRRHLVTNDWDVATLRGDELTRIADIPFAHDQQTEQAREFRIIRATEGEAILDTDYWGTFTTLPQVADSFESRELDLLCDQLCGSIDPLRDRKGEIEIAELRRLINGLWKTYFQEFDLPVPKRERRSLFRKLMSVAIRQSSTLIERIAFAILLRNGSITDRMGTPFRSKRERRLFELRYGACEPLGGINVGFLFDCGELHADLVNALASSLVSETPEAEWQQAELELQKHIHLLGHARSRATAIEGEKKRQLRERRAQKLPKPRVDVNDNEERISEASRDETYIALLRERKDAILPLLKPRDRKRLEPLLESGDFATAAEALGLELSRYRRQLRDTVIPNVKRVLEQLAKDQN